MPRHRSKFAAQAPALSQHARKALPRAPEDAYTEIVSGNM
jgi:hypothetical protein